VSVQFVRSENIGWRLRLQVKSALNENLDKRAFYAAFWNATNSVLVAAKRCAFSSR
jgi:hypothetical protein